MNSRKRKTDALPLSIRAYFYLFVFILIFCGGFSGILLKFFRENSFNNSNSNWASLFILLYIVTIALFTCTMFYIVKKKYIDSPIKKLQISAQQVTEGDFTIRLSPYRKDGKIDEIELLYEDFNKMVEGLASTETLKTDFISSVSHEIKTPIAVIQNYASYLQGENLNELEQQDYAKTIVQASKRLSLLVNDILNMNKLEHLEILPKGERYQLDEQLRRCVVTYEPQWSAKNITVAAEMDEVTVNYNENILDLVWNNLISNAIKFTENNGEIIIGLIDTVDNIEVSIQDSGCGISEETCKHIFERFYQGDTSHSSEGNGLGLAMVKKICSFYGALISVKSTLGIGTCFTITLPKNN